MMDDHKIHMLTLYETSASAVWEAEAVEADRGHNAVEGAGIRRPLADGVLMGVGRDQIRRLYLRRQIRRCVMDLSLLRVAQNGWKNCCWSVSCWYGCYGCSRYAYHRYLLA